MTPPRVIDAKYVHLALVAGRAVPTTRWAAMSAHVHTQECKAPFRGFEGYRLPAPSLLVPMNRGYWHRVLHRLGHLGPRGIRKLFGTGIRALRAESNVLRREAS